MSEEELPHRITYGPVDKSSVGLLRLIHLALLPVRYSDTIYNTLKEGIKAKGELAYFNDDTAVAEICYRIDNEEKGGEAKLYIMTIGVLPPYQHMGLATSLLERMYEHNKEIKEVYLHVHEENASAIEFYKKRGFVQGDTIQNYYTSLENGTAIVFSKKINQE